MGPNGKTSLGLERRMLGPGQYRSLPELRNGSPRAEEAHADGSRREGTGSHSEAKRNKPQRREDHGVPVVGVEAGGAAEPLRMAELGVDRGERPCRDEPDEGLRPPNQEREESGDQEHCGEGKDRHAQQGRRRGLRGVGHDIDVDRARTEDPSQVHREWRAKQPVLVAGHAHPVYTQRHAGQAGQQQEHKDDRQPDDFLRERQGPATLEDAYRQPPRHRDPNGQRGAIPWQHEREDRCGFAGEDEPPNAERPTRRRY
mmetsp:Transcript_77964/g.226182  ORF Transcript_77964/g.226182 Transcript_77964/m.226182 type:complete len:257 (-) Transcript_77964:703-1473(-)